MAWPTAPIAGQLAVASLIGEIITAMQSWGGDVTTNGYGVTDGFKIKGGVLIAGTFASVSADNLVQISAAANAIAVAGYHKAGAAAFQIGEANANATFGSGGFLRQIDSDSIRIYVDNTSEAMRFETGRVVKMYLGGTLKTLSVDGSGFVKAT